MPSTRKPNERAFRKAGRPTALCDALTATICKYLLDGAYLETAAAAAGVSKKVLHDWLRRAASDDKAGETETIHQDFRAAVEEAMAEAETRDLARITKAARKNWNAAAWRLERRNPKRWGSARRILDDEDDANAGAFRLAYSVDDDDETDPTE